MSIISSALPPVSAPNPIERPSEPASHEGKVQEVAQDHFNQPEAATPQGSAFEEWPDELLVHLLTFLDLHELVEFGCTSKSSKELISDPRIWDSIAKRIHCPIDKATDPRTQVLKFIARILQRASAIENLSDEITQILKKPTIDQINTIQDWLQAREDLPKWKALTERINQEFPNLNLEGPGEIANLSVQQLIAKGKDYRQWHTQYLELLKARDTLVVWRILAEVTGLPGGPNLQELATEQAIRNKSIEFTAWFNANQEALAGLTDLNLSDNHLTSIPTEIGQLTNLQTLRLGFNQFTSIPTDIGRLTNLQTLILSCNQLTSIPTDIGRLTHLQALDLDYNQLSSIPNEIGQLPNLQELYLDHNQLTSITGEIGRLINLRILGLKYNRLTLIPNDIGRLTNLQGLGLGGNKLISIPGEIGQLINLQELYLDHNQLTSITGEIGRLINLRILGLKYNRLTLIPNDIGRLTNLQGLGLGGNKLISIPNEIGQLPNLQELYLDHNQLSSIPNEIGQLPNLKTLDLSDNKLTTIPEALLQMGIRLFVRGNPLPLSLKARFFVRDNQKSLTITAAALATIYGLYYNREWTLGALSFVNDHLKF